MLFKGKGKARENPMNYRRISVGNIFQKSIDRYLSEETQKIARGAQGTSQYGFSKGVNFLLLTILRENVQKYATEFKKMFFAIFSLIFDIIEAVFLAACQVLYSLYIHPKCI